MANGGRDNHCNLVVLALPAPDVGATVGFLLEDALGTRSPGVRSSSALGSKVIQC
jgi:hypothetical protein